MSLFKKASQKPPRSLEDVVGLSFDERALVVARGACLLDGLTLQNAVDALSGSTDLPPQIMPIRISSLGRLIDVLVSHERIVSIHTSCSEWRQNPLIERLADDGLLEIIELPSGLLKDLESCSEIRMRELANSVVFQNFVSDLSLLPGEGSYLRIARHYHGIQGSIYSYLRSHGEIDAVRSFSDPGWVDRGKSELGSAALLFGTGAMFYRLASHLLGVPYYPFLLRSAFCAYDESRYGRTPLSGSRLAMEIVRGEAMDRLSNVGGSIDLQFFEVDMPQVFFNVLKRSKGVQEILDRAVELRETAEVTAFREGVSELTSSFFLGNVPAAIQAIESIRDSTSECFGSTSGAEKSKLKFSVAGFQLEVPIDFTRLARRFSHKRPRLTFYSLLVRELPTIWHAQVELRRIFGSKIDAMMALRLWRQLEIRAR